MKYKPEMRRLQGSHVQLLPMHLSPALNYTFRSVQTCLVKVTCAGVS